MLGMRVKSTRHDFYPYLPTLPSVIPSILSSHHDYLMFNLPLFSLLRVYRPPPLLHDTFFFLQRATIQRLQITLSAFAARIYFWRIFYDRLAFIVFGSHIYTYTHTRRSWVVIFYLLSFCDRLLLKLAFSFCALMVPGRRSLGS